MSTRRGSDRDLTPKQKARRDQGRDARRAIYRAARDAKVPNTGLPHLAEGLAKANRKRDAERARRAKERGQ